MFGISILEFIGGYIEYIFVPPFIGEWQQRTAERSVNHTRKQIFAKLTDDMRAITKNIINTEIQMDELMGVMKTQETAIQALGSSPTDTEAKKSLVSKYSVHVKTVQKLREFIHVMTRIKSELMLRIAIIQTAKNSFSLQNSPDFTADFEHAAHTLLHSETQTGQLMNLLYSGGEINWESKFEEFIRELGTYDIPGNSLAGQDKSYN